MQFRLIQTQQALRYIRYGLDRGCSLSQALLQRLEQAKIRIGTWLPRGVSNGSIYQFEQGGKLPAQQNEAVQLPSGGVLIPIPNTVPAVARYLHKQLADCKKRGTKAFLLAPDELASPSDSWVVRYEPIEGVKMLFLNEEVYFYVKEDGSFAAVEKILRRARSLAGMFSVVVFAHGDIEQGLSAELTVSLAKLFVVRAYDGESFFLVKFTDS
jgi:hypothetical protein